MTNPLVVLARGSSAIARNGAEHHIPQPSILPAAAPLDEDGVVIVVPLGGFGVALQLSLCARVASCTAYIKYILNSRAAVGVVVASEDGSPARQGTGIIGDNNYEGHIRQLG
jgi:hypothetical protein